MLVGPRPIVAAPAQATPNFSGWHLPVPAGEWLVSRGPCNALTPYDHNCNYYEERCAIDLIPTSGSMENIPMLAPQAGQVFFIGKRDDAGLTLLLLHPDGRVSGFMHLSRIVVGPDEPVTKGQVVAYAGHTGLSSGNPHLHFFVQPNAVERDCLPLEGLDEIDYLLEKARSHNLGWDELTLINPPPAVFERLPPIRVSRDREQVPLRLAVPRDTIFRLQVLLSGPISGTKILRGPAITDGSWVSSVITRTAEGAFFRVPIKAVGRSSAGTWGLATDPVLADILFTLTFTVTQPIAVVPARGILLLNPQLVSPSSYSSFDQPPELCWSLHRTAGQAPFEFRVVVVGPKPADSGWLNDTCWQPPNLSSGTYYWKVFVRDARGYMNRTNQRPFAFIIR